jgi:hypothetical protein
MFAVLVAIALLLACVLGLYLLLRSMGRDGVEAAAPGSCRSGRCGVQPDRAREAGTGDVKVVRIDEIRRKVAPSDDQVP